MGLICVVVRCGGGGGGVDEMQQCEGTDTDTYCAYGTC